MPIELTSVEEGSAYGAALLAGAASGEFEDVQQAVEACVRVRDVIEPEPRWQNAYVNGYQEFRKLYPALRAYFHSSSLVSASD